MSEKSHVLLADCVVPPCGRMAAGDEIAESDVARDTWAWLLRERMVRSLAEIEADADAAEESAAESIEPAETTETAAADAAEQPAAKSPERKKK